MDGGTEKLNIDNSGLYVQFPWMFYVDETSEKWFVTFFVLAWLDSNDSCFITCSCNV